MPGNGTGSGCAPWRRDPIVRNPAVALKETLMLGFIAKARFWQPQSVSCPLPLLLICPNKRSLLGCRVIGGHPFLSQPLFLPRCLLPPIGEIKNVAYRVTGLRVRRIIATLETNQLTVVWSIGYPASIIANPCTYKPCSQCSAQCFALIGSIGSQIIFCFSYTTSTK